MRSFINSKGYRTLLGKKKVAEHRQIAYKKIYQKNRAKYPLPFCCYDVHHKNGDRQDNRPKNLELLTREEHRVLHGLVKVDYDEE